MASESIRWELIARDEARDVLQRVGESAMRASEALRKIRVAAQRATEEGGA